MVVKHNFVEIFSLFFEYKFHIRSLASVVVCFASVLLIIMINAAANVSLLVASC